MSTIKSAELDAGATALIEAYQQSSRKLDALSQPLAQLGRHALAESAAKAGRDTRRLQSEAIADRFDRYRATINDTYGAATAEARGQALKVAKHVVYGSSIGAIWAKFVALLAVMLGIAAWFASVGASLTKSGAGLHVVVILIAAEAAVGLFWLICLVCAMLVIYGAAQVIYAPVREAQKSSLQR